MPTDHLHELRERIGRFDDSIAAFRRARDLMVTRRRNAADHVMVELDERLAVNSRALEALERSRELTNDDLKREEAALDAAARPRFIVVDDHPEGRAFLSKMLLHAFPRAEILECDQSHAASKELSAGNISALLVHRGLDVDGLPLVEMLRATSATIPIVYVSGVDRTDAALAAGATTFLHSDHAQTIGRVMRDILRTTA
jgi:CheY-like chemotaxis protein